MKVKMLGDLKRRIAEATEHHSQEAAKKFPDSVESQAAYVDDLLAIQFHAEIVRQHVPAPALPVQAVSDDVSETQKIVRLADTKTRKKRGPKPSQTPRVLEEMKQHVNSRGFADLDDMTEEAMQATFNASRDICRNAREAIRSELENSDN